jgi:hypothetical protein
VLSLKGNEFSPQGSIQTREHGRDLRDGLGEVSILYSMVLGGYRDVERAGEMNVSRGTERSNPSASATRSHVAKGIRCGKRRVIGAPFLSGKDQNQSPGPHQA